jgi:diguanylate cyclase (GGDEF)-like protein
VIDFTDQLLLFITFHSLKEGDDVFNIPINKIVQKDNIDVQSNTSLAEVIDKMDMNEKGVVVILEGKQAMGLLTERDIVKLLYQGADMSETVDKFARKSVITTAEDRTISYALSLMIENNIRRIVVTSDSENFVGVITQQDLLKFIEEDHYRSTIKVKHILDQKNYLIAMSLKEPLHEALRNMIAHNISAVVILEDGKAVGIITEKDILKLAKRHVCLDEAVETHMTSSLIIAHLNSSLEEIVSIMNNNRIRRVVIVNDEDIAVNLVTIRDVLRSLEGNYSKFLERKLKNAKDILNLLPEMLIEIADYGKEQLIIWANEKVINRFGKGIINKPVSEFIPQEIWDKIYMTSRKTHIIENIRLKKNDRVYELSGLLIITEGEIEKGRFQLILKDITEDIILSTTDPLTDIYNRRFINEFLIKEIERSSRLNKQFSIVMCDIDDFKDINDTCGHISGDKVLQSISYVIKANIRKLDIVGRYGGDEFIIILPDTDCDTASLVIERIRQKIENIEISELSRKRIKVTASFGIATFPSNGMTSDDLLLSTDERLYQAKSWGKNKVSSLY